MLAGDLPQDDAGRASRRPGFVERRRTRHGSGAGSALLDTVLDPAEPATLWVADPNPRAQAFYRRHGFVADGRAKADDGIREIRMVRSAADHSQ